MAGWERSQDFQLAILNCSKFGIILQNWSVFYTLNFVIFVICVDAERFHGTTGPVHVQPVSTPYGELSDKWIEAGKELGFDIKDANGLPDGESAECTYNLKELTKCKN